MGGSNTTQIDQNVFVMQIIEEVAAKHDLAALLQEKPFNDVNGSGKHNNWSIATRSGTHFFDPGDVMEATGNPDAFPVVMAAIVAAVDEHGDLMRAAIANPGNDFRLGACEAPPAIVSTYLGADLTDYLDAYRNGKVAAYTSADSFVETGVPQMNKVKMPSEDRNRTSPFPYGGHRFEFRAVGSAQNVALVNTCLQTMCGNVFKEVADR